MSKFFVTSKSIKDNEIKIKGKDINHIKNVLRKKIGEELTICNQDDTINYLGKIIKIEEDFIQFKIVKEL